MVLPYTQTWLEWTSPCYTKFQQTLQSILSDCQALYQPTKPCWCILLGFRILLLAAGGGGRGLDSFVEPSFSRSFFIPEEYWLTFQIVWVHGSFARS